MKNFILVLFSVLCVACATTRQATPSEKIITETRIETVYETDTVYLEVISLTFLTSSFNPPMSS